ncbi:MAG: sterol desaturase family protein [Deltaproteobacteria bacterium]|nr:sterol desaturase family protein [Deltaproteobacteria bacterium]
MFDVDLWPTTTIVLWAVLMIALERWRPYQVGQPFLRREFWTDFVWFSIVFSMAMGWVVSTLVIPGLDAATGWSTTRGIRDWPVAAQVAVSFVTHDLFIYAFHRAMHRNRYLWRLHECHHSVQEMDWAGGSRGQVFENLITGTAEFAPIALFMSPEVAVIKPVIDACWGMWIHANVDVRSGWLNYLFNGPELHRWHHSAEVYDTNFGTKLAIWDWLFGTAYLPSDKKATRLGLAEPFPTNIIAQQLFAFRSYRV